MAESIILHVTARARLASAIWLVLLHAGAAAADTDRLTRTLALPEGRALTLAITVGTVTVEGWARPDVSLEVTRHAPDARRFREFPVVIQEAPDLHIRAVQADGATDPALRTDVTVRVPFEARLTSIQIVEGRLSLSALRGTVTADVRRGPIDARDVAGTIRLETGIGDVRVTAARLVPEGLLRLRAFNGDVMLALAERPANARVMALALNGSITSELPLRMQDTWGPRWGEATIGAGEPVISIDVITGRIAITVSG